MNTVDVQMTKKMIPNPNQGVRRGTSADGVCRRREMGVTVIILKIKDFSTSWRHFMEMRSANGRLIWTFETRLHR